MSSVESHPPIWVFFPPPLRQLIVPSIFVYALYCEERFDVEVTNISIFSIYIYVWDSEQSVLLFFLGDIHP